jgi:hypothetical protein
MFPISIGSGIARDIARAHRSTPARPDRVVREQHTTRSVFGRQRRAVSVGVAVIAAAAMAMGGVAAASDDDGGQGYDGIRHHGPRGG